MSQYVPLDDKYTCIAFLGDNSGSMMSLNTEELAESVNKIIKDNLEKSKIVFYGATFSDKFNLFADGVDGSQVNITKEDLKPDGMTALVPAFARMIRIVGSRLNDMKDVRPGKVIFILLSDGEQTVARLTNSDVFDKPYEGVKGTKNLHDLVTEHKTKWSWEFMFIGTNLDSIKVGETFGLSMDNCINYNYSTEGTKTVLRCVSQNVQRTISGQVSGFNDKERLESMLGVNLN